MTPLLLILLTHGLCASAMKMGLKFAELSYQLPINSLVGRVEVRLDTGDTTPRVTTDWSRQVPERQYSVPLISGYTGLVYMSEWYDRAGSHVTAVWQPTVILNGEMVLLVSARTNDNSLYLQRQVRVTPTISRAPVTQVLSGVAVLECPPSFVKVRAGSEVTLRYRVESAEPVSVQVYMGKIAGSRGFEFSAARAAGVQVVLSGDEVSTEILVRIPTASSAHEGRLKVVVNSADLAETATFYTDVIMAPKLSLFFRQPMVLIISACDPTAETDGVINLKQGLPNCLRCTGYGFPAPLRVGFRHLGMRVHTTDSISAYQYGAQHETAVAVVLMQAVVPTNGGRYECRGEIPSHGMFSTRSITVNVV